MAENTKIEWAHHTFNGWIGCTKVGPGCDNCYAADLSKARLGVAWGPGQPRRRTAASTWKLPRRWNNRAAKEGVRYRVFCSSLADVFDNEVDPSWRADLFQLIRETPHLDWLLVTKRIGNAAKMAEAAGRWPGNVWLGATIVNQAEADRDIPKLLATDGPRCRFLSMEPLLGAVNVEPWLAPEKTCQECDDGEGYGNRCSSNQIPRAEQCPWNRAVQIVTEHGPFTKDGQPASITHEVRTLDWIIVGGESGPNARPMHPDWVRSLRDQCAAAGVPFFFKQWGEWREWDDGSGNPEPEEVENDSEIADAIYADAIKPAFISEDGRVFSRSTLPEEEPCRLVERVGKKAAGRYLDGAVHDAIPKVQL